MRKEELLRVRSDILSQITGEFYAFMDDENPNHLHALRIGIKRIRALDHFITHSWGIPMETERLSNLFRAAGQIRECLIFRHMLKDFPLSHPEISTRLGLEQQLAVEKFKKRSRSFQNDLHYVSEVSIPSLPDHRQKRSRRYILKEIRKLMTLAEMADPSSWHIFRKKLKRLLAVIKFLSPQKKKLSGVPMYNLTDLAVHLGKWHDIRAFSQYLSQRGNRHDPNLLSMLEAKGSALENSLAYHPAMRFLSGK